MMAKVEVMSSCVVGMKHSYSATAISISTLELTTWDLRLLQNTCIQRALIFHKPQKIDIDHLKNSLSQTLDLFPPLAGRLATTAHDGDMVSFFVDCNNAGAEFKHAVAAAVSVSDILEPNYTPEIVSSFVPRCGFRNFQGVSSPLLGVQVTELADGVVIGCTANHAVVDGTSFWHFINSWSQTSRGSDTISIAPVFERHNIVAQHNRLIHLPTLEQNLFPTSQSPQKVFHFSKGSLAELKAKANSEASTNKISTLQALSAHLWRSTIRCVRVQVHEPEFEACIMMAIGARARLPLPDGYFGNASFATAFTMNEAELLQKGLGYAALKISDLVSQQTNEAIIREAKAERRMFGGKARRPLFVGSSPRDDLYGNDFGWGKPIAVRSGSAQKREGVVMVMPAAEPGGIDLEVCLPREILQAMECDAEFMGSTS